MGIRGLTKLLADNAARCRSDQELKSFFGRKIAIDASMNIYQFLVAVRQGSDNLTNEAGEITSHLSGLFYRTIKLMEVGVKPCYVFDGKPPKMKSGELQKRIDAKKLAQEEAKKAEETGDAEAFEKYSRRVNKVTPEVIQQCKTLLKLMGVPVVEAPCEAEAQCASMCKGGLVYATASEDMDSLTFGTTRLVRRLWSGATATNEKKGIRPMELSLPIALEELQMDHSTFIDLCMLCGCDYMDSIKGVGPTTALNLMRKHGSIESVFAALRKDGKHVVPEVDLNEIRQLFVKPEVLSNSEINLQWTSPDEDGLIDFLVKQNSFREDTIRSGIKRMLSSRNAASQARLDTFFKKKPAAAKRKVDEDDTVSSKKGKLSHAM